MRWMGNEQLIATFRGAKKFEVFEIPTGSKLTNFKFASAFRACLLGKGSSPGTADYLLNETSCFKHVAHNLAFILGEQYRKESMEIGKDCREDDGIHLFEH